MSPSTAADPPVSSATGAPPTAPAPPPASPTPAEGAEAAQHDDQNADADLNADVDQDAEQDPLARAAERKEEGTACFRAGSWTEALVAYRAALACLPARAEPAAPPAPGRDDELDAEMAGDGAKGANEKAKEKAKEKEEEEELPEVSSPAVRAADQETARLRAVLHANVGACLVKLGDHKGAAQACSQAILDDPAYVKARERRAACNEILDTWTSLSSAQEDYTALLQLAPPTQHAALRRKLQVLKPRVEAAQKRETDEMLGKLKGLGNSILGNFGLSTDNFKFEPNATGGYSLNFQR